MIAIIPKYTDSMKVEQNICKRFFIPSIMLSVLYNAYVGGANYSCSAVRLVAATEVLRHFPKLNLRDI